MCRLCGCSVNHHEHRGFHVRKFLTREEEIKKLESYTDELKKELVAVEERIKELRNQ